MAKPVKEENNRMESRFPKESVLQSQKYVAYRDLLSAVLEDGEAYTSTEVDNVIGKFQKGMVR